MIRKRKALRLANYNYGNIGIYFVTFCAKDMACILGNITNGNMFLSAIGQTTKKVIENIATTRRGMEIIQYVIMPNHVHALILFHEEKETWSLGRIVSSIKSQVSREYAASLWQRGYYDHIIRNETDLARCREYITNNPLHWALDREYRNT